MNTRLVPVDEAFLLEFIFCLVLIFLSFGVGLDPRQSSIYGAALSPFLVGMTLGVVSWGSSFTRAGYAGACQYILDTLRSGEVGRTWLLNDMLTHYPHDSIKSGPMLWRLCSYQLSGIPLDSMGMYITEEERIRACLTMFPLKGRSSRCLHRAWYCLLCRTSLGALKVAYNAAVAEC